MFLLIKLSTRITAMKTIPTKIGISSFIILLYLISTSLRNNIFDDAGDLSVEADGITQQKPVLIREGIFESGLKENRWSASGPSTTTAQSDLENVCEQE